MPPLIAKRSIIPQFQKTNKVNYREEDEIVNIGHNYVQSLSAAHTEHLEMVRLISQDAKEIQVYSIDMRKRKMLQASFLN